MTVDRNRFRLGAWLCACVASVALVGAALAQPPKPGGPGGGGPGAGGPGPGPGGGGPGPGPGGPGGPGGPSGAPSPTFTMRVCNKANDIDVMYVAIVSVVGQQFRAQGWGQVPRGQCTNIGTFARPTIWWHVRASNGVAWQNKNERVELCVNLNGGFDYTWGGENKPCSQQGEMGVPFYKVDIPSNFPTYDLVLD
jgi:uncharacterized membrane protein